MESANPMFENSLRTRRIAFVKVGIDGTTELDVFAFIGCNDLVFGLKEYFFPCKDTDLRAKELEDRDCEALSAYETLKFYSRLCYMSLSVDDAQVRLRAERLSKLWSWLRPQTFRSWESLYNEPVSIVRIPVRSADNVELIIYCQER